MRQKPTPTSLLLLHHYQQLGLFDYQGNTTGWYPKEVMRLAQDMRITVYELGMLAAVSERSMRAYMRGTKRLPSTITLHFMNIRAWWLERKWGTLQSPVVQGPLDLI
jgi:hypothetical protein